MHVSRRATLLALAAVTLLTCVLPATASATIFVRVETDAGTGVKRLVVDSGVSSNDIVITQETAGSPLPAIGIQATNPANPDEGFVIGRDCTTARNPPRARCNTAGISAITTNLRAQELNTPPDTNSIDYTGVTQLAPGGAPLPVSVLGGPGPDTVITGDRALSATLGTGNDIVRAGAGADNVDSGAGNDIVLAGAGDDRFGDLHTPDSDILSGGPGSDQVFARGVVTLNDLLCNDGANADAPAAPLGVPRSVQAPEGTLTCGGSAADRDLIAGVERVSQAFDNSAVDFTGGSADEVLQGQQGSDRFEGGGGSDILLGSDGNDLLLARDQLADLRTDCGEGSPDSDRAVVDQQDPVEANCETIERGAAGLAGPIGGGGGIGDLPPSPPQGNQPSSRNEGNGPGGGDGRTPPQLQLPDRVALLVGRRLRIRVRCVYRAKNCVGSLTLTAAQTRRIGRTRVRRGQRLARGSVNVPWGTSRPTTMRAPRSLRSLLRRGRTLKVRVTVVARDSGGGKRARSARASRVVVLGIQR